MAQLNVNGRHFDVQAEPDTALSRNSAHPPARADAEGRHGDRADLRLLGRCRRVMRVVRMTVAATLLGVATLAYAGEAQQGWQELFAASQKDKKGLMFYVKGQTIAGVVTKVGGDAVEVRNQTYGRIVIKLDSIDAVAMN